MIRFACSVAAVALLAACQRPAPTAEAPAPVVAEAVPAPVALSPEQTEAAAFQAAWGAPPDRKGQSFDVRYTGDRSVTVGYALQGDTYKATSTPDLLTC